MQEQITFNDLPMMVSQVLSKMERLERVIETIRERIDGNSTSSAEHIPMTIDEACDFLKMKKSTMYYHVERGNITVTKRGKNFIFFKDELVPPKMRPCQISVSFYLPAIGIAFVHHVSAFRASMKAFAVLDNDQ